MAKSCQVDLDTPWKSLPKKKRDQVLYGLGEKRIRVTWGAEGSDAQGSWGMRFEGVLNSLMRCFRETSSEAMREHYRRFMSERPCDACDGQRLRPESLAVKLGERAITEVTKLDVRRAHAHFKGLALRPAEQRIAEAALREVMHRLSFLLDVGSNICRRSDRADVERLVKPNACAWQRSWVASSQA
ncbi:MAG: hypothetical protein QM784_36710 [Polyangiaceae bacterium]